jgi:hypothetical protein
LAWNPEGKLVGHIVDEVDGVVLGVPGVDLESSDPRGVGDGRVLKASDSLTVGALERQELDVHLDVVSRYPLGVALGMESSASLLGRQAVQSLASQDPRYGAVTEVNAVVSLQIPDDAPRPQMVGATQIEDLLLDFRWGPVRMALGDGLLRDKTRLSVSL